VVGSAHARIRVACKTYAKDAPTVDFTVEVVGGGLSSEQLEDMVRALNRFEHEAPIRAAQFRARYMSYLDDPALFELDKTTGEVAEISEDTTFAERGLSPVGEEDVTSKALNDLEF
jgi:hypothetical protein